MSNMVIVGSGVVGQATGKGFAKKGPCPGVEQGPRQATPPKGNRERWPAVPKTRRDAALGRFVFGHT